MNVRAIGAVIVVLLVVVVGVTGFYLTRGDSDAIQVTTIAPAQQKDMISEGRADGGVLWDPYGSDAVLSGVADAVIWSGDFWKDHPCCIIAVDNDFAKAHPEAVTAFLVAQIKALDWIQNALDDKNSEDYELLLNIVKDHSNVGEDVLIESLKHMDFKIDMDNETSGDQRGFNEWLEYYTQQFIELDVIDENKLSEAGHDNVESFINSLVNDSYFNDAKEMGESLALAEPVKMRIGQLSGDLHQLALVVSMNKYAGGGEKSMLEQMNIIPEASSPQPNGGAIMTIFSEGSLDIAYVGAPPTIQFSLNAKEVDVSIVACANVNGSALIVKKGLFEEGTSTEDTIKGLVGKVIAEPGNSTIQHLFLLSVANAYGVKVTL